MLRLRLYVPVPFALAFVPVPLLLLVMMVLVLVRVLSLILSLSLMSSRGRRRRGSSRCSNVTVFRRRGMWPDVASIETGAGLVVVVCTGTLLLALCDTITIEIIS